MPYPSRRHGLAAAVLLAGAGLAATPAHGASVVLVGASPADGRVFPTQPPPYLADFEWAVDLAGCGTALSTARVVVTQPDGTTVTSSGVTGSPPNGASAFTAAPDRPMTYRWHVIAGCPGVPDGEVRSEERSFTFTGPNRAPRLQGRHSVLVAGTRQIWRFAPRCATGACRTRARRPGSGWFTLHYQASRRRYVGTIRRVSVASERVCRVTTRRGGVVVSRRTHRRVYGVRNVRVILSVRRTASNSLKTQLLASRLVGTHGGRYVATPRGRRLGCPPGSRATAPLRASRL